MVFGKRIITLSRLTIGRMNGQLLTDIALARRAARKPTSDAKLKIFGLAWTSCSLLTMTEHNMQYAARKRFLKFLVS